LTTESEAKAARYNHTEKEADGFGRLISVRRLRPSEQAKINGFTPELSGFDEVPLANGETMRVTHRMGHILAAAVCQIDEVRVAFPRNRGELDSIYDRLDVEGLAAAGKALARLAADDRPVAEALDEAKNSQGTPSSA
jgi:hypothetical protein